ncbi:MAG: hypothetical protein ABI806_02570 [Candidatus Solibacter sp.]
MNTRLGTLVLWAAAVAALASPLQATGSYTITGRIKTLTGANSGNDQTVKYIKVIARDQGVLFDTDEGSAYAANDGTFTMTFFFLLPGGPNLYMNILYEGTALDGHFIKVRNEGSTATILDVNVEAFVHPQLAAGTHNLGILRTFNTSANIITHHGDALRFARSMYAGWAQPDDLLADARLTEGASYVEGDGSHSSIALSDYDNPGQNNDSSADIHHETWHWIAYRAYGNRGINNNCNVSPHSSNVESCEGFAMQEGNAQYFGTQSYISLYPAGDQKTGIPTATDWRGVDGDGSNNSGEIVEGALERLWRLDADNPGQTRTSLTAQADSFKAWKDAYVTLKGATDPAVITMFTNAALNGIVYTRGKITAFTEGDPPAAGPPSTGNFKVIDDIAFVRGTVNPTIGQLTLAQTPLAANSAIIAADQKDLGYKVATDDLNGDGTGFTFIGAVAFAANLPWNTTTLADNDYDLLVKLRNAHTWVDSFKPDFTGDAGAAATNEQWLKTLKTWYSSEGAPTGATKGKVIVDNKGPQATNFKPQ